MRSINRYDPFREFRQIVDGFPFLQDEFFENFNQSSSLLSLDVFQEDGSLVAEADLPGFTTDDIEVMATSDSLTVKAERKVEEKEEEPGKDYLRRERKWYTSVARSINLPSQINAEDVSAEMKDGILRITMPMAKTVTPKKIEVKVKENSD